jgi:hypothetical protein
MTKVDRKWLTGLMTAAALILCHLPAQADSIYSDFADAMLEGRGSTSTGPLDTGWPQIHPDSSGNWQLTVGEWFGTGPDSPPDSSTYGLTTIVLPFQLPNVGAVANPFQTASFGVLLNPNTGDANVTDIDLYALNRVTANPTVLASDYYRGAVIDSSATLLQESFLTPASTQGWTGAPNNFTDGIGDANLLNYMNTAYAGGAGAGQYIFLRMSYASDTFATVQDNYNINVAESDPGGGNPFAEDPVINFTAIPEPTSMLLVCMGAFLVRMFRRR